MRKSSVYLPDPLKDELASLAARRGRSEAELIRVAIERLLRSSPAPEAAPSAPPVPAGPCLVGVGVGPSDPGLVTERAVAVLRAADRVVTPSTGPDVIGRAETVVRAAVPDVTIDRVVIDIGADAAGRAASIRAAGATVVDHLDRGELVAVAVLGDPNVWSVFPRLAAAATALRPQVAVATVPGIMAFQELAAEAATVLVEGDEELALVTLGDDPDRIEPLLDDAARSVVVYKGGRHLPRVAAALDRHDRLGPAVVGEMLGLPGGRTAAVADAADRPASYLATVVAPPPRPGRPGTRPGRRSGGAPGGRP